MVVAMPDYQAGVDDFVTKLRRRQVEGSLNTAKMTAELLRQVISHQRLPNVGQAAVLIDVVKTVGLQMIEANPIGKSPLLMFQ
jgi:translation initiation factor eIF-2B subunit beta